MITQFIVGVDIAQFFTDQQKVVNAMNTKIVASDKRSCKAKLVDVDTYEANLKKAINVALVKHAPATAALAQTEVVTDIADTVTAIVYVKLKPSVHNLMASNPGVRIPQ